MLSSCEVQGGLNTHRLTAPGTQHKSARVSIFVLPQGPAGYGEQGNPRTLWWGTPNTCFQPTHPQAPSDLSRSCPLQGPPLPLSESSSLAIRAMHFSQTALRSAR